MKHLFTLAIALLVSSTAFSQKTHHVLGWKISRDIPQNEVKVNLGTTIFGLYPEVSYERIISEDFSLGITAGVGLNEDDYPLNFAIMPYTRWFFGGNSKNLQKYGAGFFIEANAAILEHGEDYDDAGNLSSEFGAGLGLALGWKYLTKNNWVGEFYLGGGRDFVNDGAYPRMGISIGKRF